MYTLLILLRSIKFLKVYINHILKKKLIIFNYKKEFIVKDKKKKPYYN